MKVEYDGKVRMFYSLVDIGDCFMADGKCYMRIKDIYDDYENENFNAVMLEKGILCEFQESELVQPIDAKVVIRFWKN